MAIQKKVNVNNASIEQAGTSRDFTSEIAEFIWNGYDAKANTVEIQYKINEVKGIESLSIIDNGEGIVYENIERTFGILLDSNKASVAGSSSYVHGKKGLGRFSFQHFCHKVEWVSIYKKAGKKYRFLITILGEDKEHFNISEEPEELEDQNLSTGCTVKFLILKDHIVKDLVSRDFIEALKLKFGWYLHLNRGRNSKLKINSTELDYQSIIVDSDSKTIPITQGDISHNFKLNYIEWKKNTGDGYYYNYFLDNNFIEKGKKTTTFNNNGIDFHHSVYVMSDYFDHYVSTAERITGQGSLFKDDEIIKELNKELNSYLQEKQKQFIERNAEILIQELEKEEALPKFEDNELGEERKKEFVVITKSLYKLEPKLFIKVKTLQKRSFLAFLKLSIDSSERENVLKIIDSIVDMSPEDRAHFAKILEFTTLSKIVITMKDIIERIKNIEILKTLVNDHEKYTNERDNIQKIMEKCFWLFGEQYSMITADRSFKTVLQKYYLDVLNKDLGDDMKLIFAHTDIAKRPDLFLCRQYPLTETTNRLGEESVIIELKKPSVDIGITQTRQIEDYMDFIIENSQYHGTSRKWKFFIVGKNLNQPVKDRVQENEDKGEEQFLFLRVRNYAIYALNWDDLFQSFKLKANFILNKLEIKKEVLLQELTTEGIDPSNIPDYLTDLVTNEEESHVGIRATN